MTYILSFSGAILRAGAAVKGIVAALLPARGAAIVLRDEVDPYPDRRVRYVPLDAPGSRKAPARPPLASRRSRPHPQGPCAYRATGSKRTRRRASAKRPFRGTCDLGGPACRLGQGKCFCAAMMD